MPTENFTWLKKWIFFIGTKNEILDIYDHLLN